MRSTGLRNIILSPDMIIISNRSEKHFRRIWLSPELNARQITRGHVLCFYLQCSPWSIKGADQAYFTRDRTVTKLINNNPHDIYIRLEPETGITQNVHNFSSIRFKVHCYSTKSTLRQPTNIVVIILSFPPNVKIDLRGLLCCRVIRWFST